MLQDFANLQPGQFEWFLTHWEDPLVWSGGNEALENAQRLVREIWLGKQKGNEGGIIDSQLATLAPQGDSSGRLLLADWRTGSFWLSSPYLNAYVWLTLLQFHDQLAICANKETCVTPYFIKRRKDQKFCSEDCAVMRQREHKLHWWKEHGEEWRAKRAVNLKRRK